MSPSVEEKLSKRGIDRETIYQCFLNRDTNFDYKIDEVYRTTPPTLWFCSETDEGRALVVCFMKENESPDIIIKSAFDAKKSWQDDYFSED